MSNTEIKAVVDTVLRENPTQVKEYLAGNEKLLGFFVGQVMKHNHTLRPTFVNLQLKRALQKA